MVDRQKQLSRLSNAGSGETDLILFAGTGRLGMDVSWDSLTQFALSEYKIEVKTVEDLQELQKMESMVAPVVLVLGYSDESIDLIHRIKHVWPNTAVIVAAPIEQLPQVYSLIARGAVDYIPTDASTESVRAKCLLRVGAFHARVTESSRNLGRLTINLMQRTVSNGRDSASLTPIEIKIVTTLADSLGGVVERHKMKQMCWGDLAITDNALNRKIYEVRRTLRKLSQDVNIRTIYGMGFELTVKN